MRVQNVKKVETYAADPRADNNNDIEMSDNDDDPTTNLVMPERKTKDPSPVWTCATRVEGGAKCRFCPSIIKCSKSSTSSLLHHLLMRHKNETAIKFLEKAMSHKRDALKLKRLQNEKKKVVNKQPSILNFSKRRGVIDPFKKKRLDESIIKMIIMMNKPFSDINNTFFRQVLFTAEPNYLCPSRNTITNMFDEMATKVKEDLKNEIATDIEAAGDLTLNICSDHGTSSDRFRTKRIKLLWLEQLKTLLSRKTP